MASPVRKNILEAQWGTAQYGGFAVDKKDRREGGEKRASFKFTRGGRQALQVIYATTGKGALERRQGERLV